ncbi:hypothetical protein EJD97_007449 [Solanum chilense]|uniref:GPI-anchored protein LLG1-like domain-containing protein n=1 Tax=Solanum chilense TaxID=4083 RepID=A0A6N2AKC1_SOLCI|nr:hypothetical protein EJD97_007449 [Solanum chilense]
MAFERSCFFLFFFFLAIGLASSSPNHTSNDALNGHMLGGRALLEKLYVKDDCPVDFEKEDLTPITGTCKGPYYNPLVCCNAFAQIACKYAELINNVENGCSTGLFYALNKQGGYPNNLFAQICKGDKEGLPCDKAKVANKGRH